MAHTTTIPLGKPGIASFESETYGNSGELLYGDTPAQVEKSYEVTSATAAELVLGSVVSIAPDGALTMAESGVGAASNATHILATHAVFSAGETMELPFYEAGHYRQQALTFDPSFNTDALKQNAFRGSETPMILISKAKFDDADFPA